MDRGSIVKSPIFRLLVAVVIAPLLLFGPMALGPAILMMSIGIVIHHGCWED